MRWRTKAKDGENRNCCLSVRLSEKEMDQWERYCWREFEYASVMARKVMIQALRNEGIDV